MIYEPVLFHIQSPELTLKGRTSAPIEAWKGNLFPPVVSKSIKQYTRRTGGVIEKLHIKQRYYNVLLCKYYKKLFCVSNERKSSRSTNLTERNPDGDAANGVKVAGDKLVDGGDAALHVDASRHLRKILQFLHLDDI